MKHLPPWKKACPMAFWLTAMLNSLKEEKVKVVYPARLATNYTAIDWMMWMSIRQASSD